MTGRQLFKLLQRFELLFILPAKIYDRFVSPCVLATYWGVIWRYYRFRSKFRACGLNVTIHRNVILQHPRNISVGENVSIHPLCYIDGEGGIIIGNNVSIAHNTTIMSSNHTWVNNELPIKYCPKSLEKVTIGDDVWIGCGVRIMAGVSIGKRCIIAAGAVVTKDCEPNSLYGGVPAKKIKSI